MKTWIEVFKALSDETRVEMMWLLSQASSGLCVCEIMDALDKSQYHISRHLKVLKNAGLVEDHKRGRWSFYAAISPQNQFHALILQAIAALTGDRFAGMNARLQQRLALREDGECVIGVQSETWRSMLSQLPEQGVNADVP